MQGFSALVRLAFWTGYVFFVEAVLYDVGYLATSLTSTHWARVVTFSPCVITKHVSGIDRCLLGGKVTPI